tara:strand:- start:1132 stop:1731 length:600 start_codon:yes stop_codon:yes gene_type:complete
MFTIFGILLCLPASNVDGFPNGVGDIEGGCQCHGDSNSNTNIALFGLPEKFVSSTNYTLTIELSNQIIESNLESAQGGFRIVLEGGELFFENDTGHLIDDGWTHKESSNQQRTWNLTWTSPSDNTTMSKFIVYGNAVNGNQLSNGDNWDVVEIYVPGEQNFDPIPNSSIINHELESFDKVMLTLGLLVLLYICFRITKD